MFGGIPFEHFAHGGGGGFPGGGMGRGGGGEPPDTEKLYETLEVAKDATAKDIKKSYFRLSKVHHPDRGGDAHKFKEINAAYEILSDPEKRKAYDQYGLEGVDDEGGTAARGEDLFSMFFGGGGRRGRLHSERASLNERARRSACGGGGLGNAPKKRLCARAGVKGRALAVC